MIIVHTTPFGSRFEGTWSGYVFGFIRPLIQFAVPFFFVISGYFWGVKIRNGVPIRETLTKTLKRLLVIFIVWTIIYSVPHNLVSIYREHGVLGTIEFIYLDLASMVSSDPIAFLFQGSSEHLWFLTALASAMAISSFFVHRGLQRSLLALSIGFYVICMLAKAYSATPLGIDFGFNARNGPFAGTIFFVTGYLLSGCRPGLSWLPLGLSLVCAGYLVWYCEICLLQKFYGPVPYEKYIIGTYLMGVGASIIALSDHPLVGSIRLATLGRLTLGIYVSHGIFVKLLRPFDKIVFHPLWELGYVLIVLVLAIGVTFLLSRSKYTRPFVV